MNAISSFGEQVVETESICGKADLSCRGMQEILHSATKIIFFVPLRMAEKKYASFGLEIRDSVDVKRKIKKLLRKKFAIWLPVGVVFVQLYSTLLAQIN